MSTTSRQPKQLRDAQGQYLKALGRLCEIEDLLQRRRLAHAETPSRQRTGGGFRIVRKAIPA